MILSLSWATGSLVRVGRGSGAVRFTKSYGHEMNPSHLRGKKTNKAQRADHRQRIADMRLKSFTIRQIAVALRLSVSTVKRELRKLAAEWRRNAAETVDTHRQIELARLELIAHQAWVEFERSREDYFKETTERMKMPGTEAEEGGDLETVPKLIRRDTGGRLGDPRYLQVALSALERRCKILGLDAPTKVAPKTSDGELPYDLKKMSNAELNARIAELAAKRGVFPVPPNMTPEAWTAWAQSQRKPQSEVTPDR